MRLKEIRIGQDYALAPRSHPDRVTVLEVGLPWATTPYEEKSQGVSVRLCGISYEYIRVVHFRALLMPWSEWEEQEQQRRRAEQETRQQSDNYWSRVQTAVTRIYAASPELQLAHELPRSGTYHPAILSLNQLEMLATLLEGSPSATK